MEQCSRIQWNRLLYQNLPPYLGYYLQVALYVVQTKVMIALLSKGVVTTKVIILFLYRSVAGSDLHVLLDCG